MEWLNYHHLFYFWRVVKEGSVVRAARTLRLSQPTLSAQIKLLEEALQEPLFDRAGRNLQLTEVGKTVARYAETIFSTGQELLDVVKGRTAGAGKELRVGISDIVPKLVSYRLVAPLFEMEEPPKVICLEDKTEKLLADLAIHEVDVVICDTPIPPTVRIRAYNHFLGESGISFLGTKALQAKYQRRFPHSLDLEPMLLPTHSASVRREIDRWFETIGISPRILGEFDDSALMKEFGAAGVGVIPVPRSVEREVMKEYGLAVIGRTEEIKERFYLISLEKKVKHPGILLLIKKAKESLDE